MAGRVVADERGPRAVFDEIAIGAELPSAEWIVTESDIDGCCQVHSDFHEWYSIDSPFGGRVAPPWISYVPAREIFKTKYRVRGLFVGWISEQLDVIRPHEKMLWQGRISDKYVKRDREWLWYDWTLTGADGREIIKTRRGHVMDFLPISTPKTAVSSYAGSDADLPPSEQYAPPTFSPKKTEEIVRESDASIWETRAADRNTEVGTRLTPASQLLSWRHTRDYYDILVAPWVPKSMVVRNIHTDPQMAKDEGLAAPNSIAPQCAGPISRMMLAFIGAGWLKGGRFDLKFIKQIPLDDFITAKGVVTGKRLEGDSVRLECEVWVENLQGRKVIVGKASGLVPA